MPPRTDRGCSIDKSHNHTNQFDHNHQTMIIVKAKKKRKQSKKALQKSQKWMQFFQKMNQKEPTFFKSPKMPKKRPLELTEDVVLYFLVLKPENNWWKKTKSGKKWTKMIMNGMWSNGVSKVMEAVQKGSPSFIPKAPTSDGGTKQMEEMGDVGYFKLPHTPLSESEKKNPAPCLWLLHGDSSPFKTLSEWCSLFHKLPKGGGRNKNIEKMSLTVKWLLSLFCKRNHFLWPMIFREPHQGTFNTLRY